MTLRLDGPDIVNASLEFIGALFQLLNVRAILRDRQIQGVSWLPTLFFWSWGLWNLYFYSHLGQWASLIGGLMLTGTNLLWLLIAVPIFYHKE